MSQTSNQPVDDPCDMFTTQSHENCLPVQQLRKDLDDVRAQLGKRTRERDKSAQGTERWKRILARVGTSLSAAADLDIEQTPFGDPVLSLNTREPEHEQGNELTADQGLPPLDQNAGLESTP